MPLDKTAKISDVITSLEGMQGINQKVELASVIGAPASASDNIATQITKLQGAKDVLASKIGVPNTTHLQAMVDGLVVGKKWASGTVVTSGGRAVVSGLSFLPSFIIVYMSLTNQSVYNSKISTTVCSYMNGGSSYSAACTVTNTSFDLPTAQNNTYSWIAFE